MFDIEDLTEEAKTKYLTLIIDKLDELDQEDFFGSEGWKHYFGLED